MAFQSFGSYGTFQQTPFPDRARKILEEQRSRSSNEQNYQKQLNQQNQNYLEVMREKLTAERENRRRNFDYENSLKQQQQDAVERNNRQQQANATNQAANQASMYTALADLSGKLVSILPNRRILRKRKKLQKLIRNSRTKLHTINSHKVFFLLRQKTNKHLQRLMPQEW